MKNFSLRVGIRMLFLFLSTSISLAQGTKKGIEDYNLFSEEFLQCVKERKDTKIFREQLADTTLEALADGLKTDNEKLAFWVNIYNAYIQVILLENPELYDDRNRFFEKKQIAIAGEMISFGKIEHGIIRKSQWALGLGYFRKWFPDKLERALRVDKGDYRIHFALNCGAKDCPPVAIYSPKRLDGQFDKGTRLYLKKTSTYKKKTNEVTVTALFNWFRGDFGSKSGIKDILKENDVIPTTEGVCISYKNYDWTLELDNWIEL